MREGITNLECEVQKPTIQFGSYFPEKKLTTDEIGSWKVMTSGGRELTSEYCSKLIGDIDRHIAAPHESVLKMATSASLRALYGKFNADFIIASTSFPTGDDLSLKIGERLGLSTKRQNCINIHAACSGFGASLEYLYRKDNENGRKGQLDGARVLLVASENYHNGYMVPLKENEALEKDPGISQAIFSDGAVAISAILGQDLTILHAESKTDFSIDENNSIKMPIEVSLARGLDEGRCYIKKVPYPHETDKIFQDGHAVFEAMSMHIPSFVSQLVDNSGVSHDKISAVIPHQGSRRMTASLEKSLKGEFGEVLKYPLNLSSATIPNVLKNSMEKGSVVKDDILVTVGFGGGLMASGAVIKLGRR